MRFPSAWLCLVDPSLSLTSGHLRPKLAGGHQDFGNGPCLVEPLLVGSNIIPINLMQIERSLGVFVREPIGAYAEELIGTAGMCIFSMSFDFDVGKDQVGGT